MDYERYNRPERRHNGEKKEESKTMKQLLREIDEKPISPRKQKVEEPEVRPLEEVLKPKKESPTK